MSTEPSTAPHPEVQPSSTPDGPQVIPAPGTPEGEPGPDFADRVAHAAMDGGSGVPFDNRDSTPNSSGDAGTSGDMGVSSERTGPLASDDDPLRTDITGTGSKGGAVGRTDGELDTSASSWDAPDVSRAESDPRRQHTDGDVRDEEAGYAEQSADFSTGIDRTVGEPNSMPFGGDKPHSSGA